MTSCPEMSRATADPAPLQSPYAELHIYYLAGRYRPTAELTGQSFIGHWQEENCCFLFFSAPAEDFIAQIVKGQAQLRYVDHYCMSYDQWQGGPLATFRQGKFRITPPWECGRQKERGADDALDIVLDPGVVFGAGTHATTRNCLEALELACSRGVPARVLDLGSGSGLLALAAARLGCSKIVAVDINWLAAQTAKRNVGHNQLADHILVVQGKAEDLVHLAAELVVANIHYDVMLRLVRSQGFRGCPKFILSGLLRTEAKEVAEILTQLGATIRRQWAHEGTWHTFYGEFPAHVTRTI